MTEFWLLLQNPYFGAPFALGLGLIFGSFFNVCIARMPHDRSILKERSHCPKCGAPITWRRNIPLVSYVLLRGRCGGRQPISIQYPLVELTTGLFFVHLYFRFGYTWSGLAAAVFVSALIVISVIDLHHQIIPDEISLPGILIGFVLTFAIHQVTWTESLLGILIGGGSFYLVAYLYERFSGREGLGGGDIKLLAMMGAWLGHHSVLPIIVISSALGSIVGVGLMWLQRRDFRTAIPFGPFMAVGAYVYLIWAPPIREFLFPFEN